MYGRVGCGNRKGTDDGDGDGDGGDGNVMIMLTVVY